MIYSSVNISPNFGLSSLFEYFLMSSFSLSNSSFFIDSSIFLFFVSIFIILASTSSPFLRKYSGRFTLSSHEKLFIFINTSISSGSFTNTPKGTVFLHYDSNNSSQRIILPERFVPVIYKHFFN